MLAESSTSRPLRTVYVAALVLAVAIYAHMPFHGADFWTVIGLSVVSGTASAAWSRCRWTRTS